MTTDDLRTRARRAAARVYPFDGTDPNAVIALRSAYVHGFLAAYEQLPGWEEIARAIAAHHWDRDSGDVETWDNLTAVEQENVIENYLTRDSADAVLALIRGGQS